MQNGGGFNDIEVFHLHVIPRFNAKEFEYNKKGKLGIIDIGKLRSGMNQEINKTKDSNG